jgi:hypothetical protein
MSEVNTAQAAKAPTRAPSEIEADLVATRERLVGTIAQIEDRVKPANLLQSGKQKIQSIYVDDNGVQWKRVAMTVGAVGGALIGIRILSSTVRWTLAIPKDRPVEVDVVYLPVPRAQVATLASLI